VIGLGAAISQLHRIADMLGARPLSRANRPIEPFDEPAAVRLGTGPGRVPFPPRPKAEPAHEPLGREPVSESPPAPHRAEDDREAEFGLPPSLRNPDMPLMAEEEAEQLPLSPRHAPPASPPPRSGLAFPERSMPPPMMPAPNPEPEPGDQASQTSFEPDWNLPPPPPRRPPPPSNFDAAWPAQPKAAPPPMAPPAEPPPSRAETIARAPNVPSAAEPPPADMPVAILKSGVVDGMGYTLYVDGSIEAELPDGTLRFASITELRQHLEQNS
jgi:hypothetical protein